MDMAQRREFIRTELILGRTGMEKLRESTVAVFGIGGVGSHCAEALARSGVGRLILIDNDDYQPPVRCLPQYGGDEKDEGNGRDYQGNMPGYADHDF